MRINGVSESTSLTRVRSILPNADHNRADFRQRQVFAKIFYCLRRIQDGLDMKPAEAIPLAEGKNLPNREPLIRDDVKVTPVFVMQFQHSHPAEIQLPFE
jgi:hypothetical protein